MQDDTSVTTSAATTTILAIDLGKFKSVACVYDHASGTHRYQTITTSPRSVHDLLIEVAPPRVVIEASSIVMRRMRQPSRTRGSGWATHGRRTRSVDTGL